MTDDEIIKELEGAIEFAQKTREYYLKKVAECNSLIAKNTRLIEVLKNRKEMITMATITEDYIKTDKV